MNAITAAYRWLNDQGPAFGSAPSLHLLLACECVGDAVVLLDVHQTNGATSLRVLGAFADLVQPHATLDAADRAADIEAAVSAFQDRPPATRRFVLSDPG